MQTYKVPIDGYYMVSQEIAYYTPTGKMETVPNPDREWWEFWKPMTITQPEYIMEWKPNGQQILKLKTGEEVLSKTQIIRIGG